MGWTQLVPELICTLVVPIRTWTKWREVEEWFVNLLKSLSHLLVAQNICKAFFVNMTIMRENLE